VDTHIFGVVSFASINSGFDWWADNSKKCIHAPQNVYNAFLCPDLVSNTAKARVEELAVQLLAAQAETGETYERMYDPRLMPAELRSTHKSLDRAVENCLRSKLFSGHEERIDFLFDAYKAKMAPLDLSPTDPKRRTRKFYFKARFASLPGMAL
jgi:hypothetical protein